MNCSQQARQSYTSGTVASKFSPDAAAILCSSSCVVLSCMQAAEGAYCIVLTAPLCQAVAQDAMAARQSKKNWWLRKAALRISLAYRNGLQNVSWQIFSACIKFGGNRFRDVKTHRFYTHTHTHTHTRMKLYIRLLLLLLLLLLFSTLHNSQKRLV